MSDDCTDLAGFNSGDTDAFGRLYDRHAPVVLAYCTRRVPNRSQAEGEDALQETFTRAYRMLDRVDDCLGFRSWLFRIARYVCSENIRKHIRRVDHERGAAEHNSMIRSIRSDEETRTGRNEQYERLEIALDRLEETERLVIHLQYLDPKPVEAARRTLGLSRSGYYKVLNRARGQLELLMSKEMSA